MTINAHIKIDNDQQIFGPGDKVHGLVEVQLPKDVPVTNVAVSFRCKGEVKWTEYIGSPCFLNGSFFHDHRYYHREALAFGPSNVKIDSKEAHKLVTISFEFVIPKDKNLPSTMDGDYGFIKYFIGVTVKSSDSQDAVNKFSKEIVVHAPMKDNLNISVIGSAEKHVLLHGGNVSMHATIDRKGYSAGDTIQVHLAVDNSTKTHVTPRILLQQFQIYMCGTVHKSIQVSLLADKPIMGTEVEPHAQSKQLFNVAIPNNEKMLSVKSSLICVKYVVRVVLDIPHSFDLNVDLPIVLTKQDVVGL